MVIRMFAMISKLKILKTFIYAKFSPPFIWRSCLEATCVPGCILPSIIDAKSLTPLQTNSSSCRDGLLEPACRLAGGQKIRIFAHFYNKFFTNRVSFVNQLGTPCLGYNFAIVSSSSLIWTQNPFQGQQNECSYFEQQCPLSSSQAQFLPWLQPLP